MQIVARRDDATRDPSASPFPCPRCVHLQLAFYRQYGSFVPTYESCSTAAFLKGRTECMRSATSASREAVLALAKQDMPSDTRALIQKAADVHTQLVKEASMGITISLQFP